MLAEVDLRWRPAHESDRVVLPVSDVVTCIGSKNLVAAVEVVEVHIKDVEGVVALVGRDDGCAGVSGSLASAIRPAPVEPVRKRREVVI